MSQGQHIELFLVDGTAGGITTAEIIGWTGHVLAWPRPDLADVLKRPEAARNGVYLLLGESEDAVGGVRCYIGKTENFAARFSQHDRQRISGIGRCWLRRRTIRSMRAIGGIWRPV